MNEEKDTLGLNDDLKAIASSEESRDEQAIRAEVKILARHESEIVHIAESKFPYGHGNQEVPLYITRYDTMEGRVMNTVGIKDLMLGDLPTSATIFSIDSSEQLDEKKRKLGTKANYMLSINGLHEDEATNNQVETNLL